MSSTLSIIEIKRIVAERYGLAPDDLDNTRWRPRYCEASQVSVFFARALTGKSFQVIARRHGRDYDTIAGKRHSTIVNRIRTEPVFAHWISDIYDDLMNRSVGVQHGADTVGSPRMMSATGLGNRIDVLFRKRCEALGLNYDAALRRPLQALAEYENNTLVVRPDGIVPFPTAHPVQRDHKLPKEPRPRPENPSFRPPLRRRQTRSASGIAPEITGTEDCGATILTNHARIYIRGE